MSSPPVGGAGSSPEPNWYADPSIPGYIRFWSGSGWVPGTSRPEPAPGEAPPAPPVPVPGAAPVGHEPAPWSEAAPQEPAPDGAPGATGEEPPGPAGTSGDAAAPAADPRDETPPAATASATAMARDTDRDAQDDRTVRVGPLSRAPEPTVPPEPEPEPEAEPAPAPDQPAPPADPRATGPVHSGSAAESGTSSAPAAPAEHGPAPELPRQGGAPAGALPALRGRATPAPASSAPAWSPDDDASTSPVAAIGRGGRGPAPASSADPRTRFRSPAESPPPAAGELQAAGDGPADGGAPAVDEPSPVERTMGIRRVDAAGGSWKRQVRDLAAHDAAAGALPAQQGPVRPTPAATGPHAPAATGHPGYGYPGHPSPDQGPQRHAPGAPQGRPELPAGSHALPTQAVQASGPERAGTGSEHPFSASAQPFGGAELALHGAGAAPVRPVQSLPLAATAPWETELGQAYPAGLGRRLTARLLDSLLPLAAGAAVAWPLVGRARDHVQGKIEAVERAGVTDTVWLLDTTTAGYLGMVLGAVLLVSLVLEALPSAVWGRSPGKAATGLRLATMDGHDKPGAGSVLVRWLTYSVLGMLLVGLVNVVWCLWDRPWRQCWHDKVAGTFVAAVRRQD
ncbi:RDD family protein [Streptomyces bohaiensis]|uniref:DUF2510 domain-containing protein n=2 Tax=Streptomyces bohaiensis TaxID=1431344 RepID=A0ABX1CI78_9ACTN|nr:RDD family protein [Streptomyces bohaiensis]NJQ17157.1 DUF2510 domain-containing protein [Streptomyces bohaiensis]